MSDVPGYLLKVAALTKKYPEGFELGPLDFEWETGACIGLLGPNGAGKSTLYQMLTGNMDASSGTIMLRDQKMVPDKPELKRKIGYLPQSLELPKWVTGLEILSYAAKLYGESKEKVMERLGFFSCLSYQNKPLASCSHGMQKRVGLALATLHNPDLLILDEPFSGLDIFQINALKQHIKLRSSEGKTSILSTHIPPFAAELCSSCWLLQEGQAKKIPGWEEMDNTARIGRIEAAFFGEPKN